jgi:hypothetical protein
MSRFSVFGHHCRIISDEVAPPCMTGQRPPVFMSFPFVAICFLLCDKVDEIRPDGNARIAVLLTLRGTIDR